MNGSYIQKGEDTNSIRFINDDKFIKKGFHTEKKAKGFKTPWYMN